jgi:tetratricopeptide (TPR) repeat protein
MPGYALRRAIKRTTLIALMLVYAAAPQALGQETSTFDVVVSAADQALMTRAESLIANGQADRAYDILGDREADLAGNPYFDYLLGVAALDAGHVSEAIFSLRRSVAVAPRYAGARMELGRAYYESGNVGQARPLFVSLLDENPPPGVRGVIQQYIDAIDQKPSIPGSRIRPYLEVRTGHDSNANGSTSNQQFLGFMLNPQNLETESPFAEIAAGFTWIVPQSSRFAWLYNGRVGHRDNTDASFINATTLNGFAGGTWQRGDWFGRAGADGYWASRDGDSHQNYTGVDLLVGNRVAENWDMTLGLRGGAQRFDTAINVLDVDRFLYTVGVTRRFSATSRLTLQAIGGNDREKQNGSQRISLRQLEIRRSTESQHGTW